MDFLNGTKRSARLLGIRPDLTLQEASELINPLSKRSKRIKEWCTSSNHINLDVETTAALVPLPANQRFITEDAVPKEENYFDKDGVNK